jgi:Na+-transporting NADH:ubiquinone oxidoreductase subunit C
VANNDSVSKTLLVAFLLCVVCSVVVSTAAVLLKPMQDANVEQDRKRNILGAAGMLEAGIDIDEQFSQISLQLVDLRTGQFSNAQDADSYDQLKAARDASSSDALDSGADTAKVGRREHYGLVYLVGDASNPEIIILPIRGAGLWGPLYGFIALEGDANTVAGLGFYEHKETPGLGGEVDNPRWKALWPGKQVYRDGDVVVTLGLIKGAVDRSRPEAVYQVDGLSGATLTSRGVTNLVQFWLGENGYGPFLANLKAGEA